VPGVIATHTLVMVVNLTVFDVQYADGALIMSGSTCLRCDRGIWVEAGTKAF
jgi:hypothetical protein